LTEAVAVMPPVSGMTAAVCAALGVSRTTVERRRSRLKTLLPVPSFASLASIGPSPNTGVLAEPFGLAAARSVARSRPAPARALTAPQRQAVLDLLHAPRFADQAPAEIYATLLDELRGSRKRESIPLRFEL
jgi:putative transposase